MIASFTLFFAFQVASDLISRLLFVGVLGAVAGLGIGLHGIVGAIVITWVFGWFN
jgi:hypothetical protein